MQGSGKNVRRCLSLDVPVHHMQRVPAVVPPWANAEWGCPPQHNEHNEHEQAEHAEHAEHTEHTELTEHNAHNEHAEHEEHAEHTLSTR